MLNTAYRTVPVPNQGTSEISKDDFLTIMVDSMKNSTMENGMSSADFASNMSQYASMSGMEDLTQSVQTLITNQEQSALIANINSASALIGKTIVADGNTGVVESVSVSDGTVKLMVGGKGYSVSQVTSVLASGTDAKAAQTAYAPAAEIPSSGAGDDTIINMVSESDELTTQTRTVDAPNYANYLNTDNSDIISLSRAGTATGAVSLSDASTYIPPVQLAQQLSSQPVQTPANTVQSTAATTAASTTTRSASNVDATTYNDYIKRCREFASATNTKMADVRWIFNQAVNGRIKTDTVLGITSTGQAYTEIGYCGKGTLGEVVTWADGTQRVEVISPYGYSTWLTTTGNYTLNEICNFSYRNGELAGKLSGQEIAIRHFAREYSLQEKALMNSYKNYMSTVPKFTDGIGV